MELNGDSRGVAARMNKAQGRLERGLEPGIDRARGREVGWRRYAGAGSPGRP